MSPEQVRARIKAGIAGAEVDVQGADCSFEVQVTSGSFHGMRLLERQRCVLSLFNEELADGSLHALSVVAITPSEMAPRKSQPQSPATNSKIEIVTLEETVR